MSKITIGQKIGRPKSIYRVSVEFMWGDADGETTEYVDIPEKEIESPEAKHFLYTVERMEKHDNKGRGGMDSTSELLEHYEQAGISRQDVLKFFDLYLEDDDSEEEIEESAYRMQYPTGEEGYFYSVRNITITYFNKQGDEYETNYNND